MADATITSFFTKDSIPATGLVPTVSIYQIDPPLLVIESADMSEVGGGFYKYIFTNTQGYTLDKQYTVLSYGGLSLDPQDRYGTGVLAIQPVDLTPSSTATVASSVWDQLSVEHNLPNTFGALVQAAETISAADIARISGSVWDELLIDHTIDGSASDVLTTALDVVVTILKYQQNRTKIDPQAKTLTVYDNDQTTPLRVFNLRDRTAQSSVEEVFERTVV